MKKQTPTNNMNPKVDLFLSKVKKWKDEIEALREVALESGLVEELKWGQPCYMFEKNNIAIIGAFKEYFAFMFFKGALLKDPEKILIAQTENVQSSRQIRFTNVAEIKKLKSVIKDYIKEAIENEKSGLKVEFKKVAEYKIPEELQTKFNKDKKFKTAFEALTPGRQRAYILFFSGAKQSKTREDRIEKNIPNILKGKGLNE